MASAAARSTTGPIICDIFPHLILSSKRGSTPQFRGTPLLKIRNAKTDQIRKINFWAKKSAESAKKVSKPPVKPKSKKIDKSRQNVTKVDKTDQNAPDIHNNNTLSATLTLRRVHSPQTHHFGFSLMSAFNHITHRREVPPQTTPLRISLMSSFNP